FLERFRPRLRYFLISEWAYPEEDLPNCHNLVAALFRLERLDSPEGVVELLEALNVWLDAPEQRELRRSIAIWLRASLMKHKKHPLVLPELDDLQEIRVMLSEQMGVWAKRYHQEGRMEGKQEGLREGVQQGLQKGLQKGVRKGRQEGLLEGEANLLRKQMERRFGALPTWAKDRLAQANQGDLETWGEAILTAPTLEAVFTDTSAH
ncbi:MAG: DUF4351 domain-containing protein, partial [Pseudomonadota bacterium]